MWTVEAEREVEDRLGGLNPRHLVRADGRIGCLGAESSLPGPPTSGPLGCGLFELRFTLADSRRRITCRFADGRRIVLLTTLTKQRCNEKAEIRRARDARAQSIRAEDSET